jgi:Cft2 family RNA processing exonuclease
MAEEGDFEAYLDDVDARIRAVTPIALAKGMEHVRGVSVELTPEETGHLIGSAGVTVEGDEAQLLFPGPYARNQHYSLDFRHTKGQALYLEQPMTTEAGKVLQIIADEIGGVM